MHENYTKASMKVSAVYKALIWHLQYTYGHHLSRKHIHLMYNYMMHVIEEVKHHVNILQRILVSQSWFYF